MGLYIKQRYPEISAGTEQACTDTRLSVHGWSHIIFDGLGSSDGLQRLQQTASLTGDAWSCTGCTHISSLHYSARSNAALKPSAQHLLAAVYYHQSGHQSCTMLLCLKKVCLPAASTTICLLQQNVCATFLGDWDA